MKIKGLNLGNWLVLERWMDERPFAGTKALDEDALCRMLPREELEDRLKKHRDTFVTREDFQWIKAQGIEVIRLPVPHFVLGDDEEACWPYVPCLSYVDDAFSWAEELGLAILIDLHTAPESQNGFDNGGICGVCRWAQDPSRVERVIQVLEGLARRYKDHPALFGIELLNEPISEEVFTRTQKAYVALDTERAKGSAPVSLEMLYGFYQKAYTRLREILRPETWIVMHDAFRSWGWDAFFADPQYQNVMLDVHWYPFMDLKEGEDALDLLQDVLAKRGRELKRLNSIVPTVVGEWCVAHHLHEGKETLKNDILHRLSASAQLLAWQNGSGSFFWSYKLDNGPSGWCYREAIQRGWLPAYAQEQQEE